MIGFKRHFGPRVSFGQVTGAILCLLAFVGTSTAQSPRTIDAGTTIAVRTNERIYTTISDGRVYSGVLTDDVASNGGRVAIQQGSAVELVVRDAGRNLVALDLDAIVVNGQQYGIQTQGGAIAPRSAQRIGANERTGQFVGGGALIGVIIGAIAGGGKGAAIGGGVGAASGAVAQIMTRGQVVEVPAGSTVRFRLQQPLEIGAVDPGFNRYGQHYHSGSYTSNPGTSVAYQDGLRSGSEDSDHNVKPTAQSNRWVGGQQRRDYQAGYDIGYDGSPFNGRSGDGVVNIGSDRYINWQGPAGGNLYVQADGKPRQLFASGVSGHQLAPWMTTGHLYVFFLLDGRGNEIARDQIDLRKKR